VTPSNVNLQIGGTQLFTASGFDADGNPVPVTPTWGTTGGTITPGGLYTATVVGDFTVTASVEGSPVTGTGAIHVNPGQLATIDVTPSNVNLQIGGTQLFTANGFDAGGNPVPITPTWSTTGGNVTQTGLYTATTAGNFTITAAQPGTAIRGFARVRVAGAGRIVRIVVTPGAARLRFGGWLTFTAIGLDERRRPVPITVVWSATGGTITADGLYTAGARPGCFHVTARIPGVRPSGFATMWVLRR